MLLKSCVIISVLQSPSKIYKAKLSSQKILLYQRMCYPLAYLFRLYSARKCAIMLTSTWQHALFKTLHEVLLLSIYLGFSFQTWKSQCLHSTTSRKYCNLTPAEAETSTKSSVAALPPFEYLLLPTKTFIIFQPNKSVVTLNQDVSYQNEW